jgi:predicted  nucleic acid-binding Zn-ribbon protein
MPFAAQQGADQEALANLEDSAGEVGARLQQLDADQAGLREHIEATEAGLAAAQRELAAKKRAHEAAAAANRRALCAPSLPAAHCDS